MSNGSVSGLSPDHRHHARVIIAKDAKNMLANKGKVHYSQGPHRMDGIRLKLTHLNNTFPTEVDCSGSAYWMLWDATARPYGLRDLVCHANWNPNGLIFTGSMYKNGKAVVHDANLMIGDLIFYGNQGGGVPEHVAVYMGGGMVFSQGSEAGPFLLPLDYRKDRRMARRYI